MIYLISWIYSLVISIPLIIYFIHKVYDKSKNKLPNGPKGIPLLGSLPFLANDPPQILLNFHKRYGNIYSVQLGNQLVIVLNDWVSIKEVLFNDAVLGRPFDSIFNAIVKKPNLGIENGQHWSEQRKFTFHHLKKLGFGKTSMESHILDEIKCLFEEIDELNGQEVDLRKYLKTSVANNIISILFGKRFDHNNNDIRWLDAILEPGANFNLLGFVAFFPWVIRFIFRYIYFLLPSNLKRLRIICIQAFQFIGEEIARHENTLNEDDIRDYIDAFLIEMRNRENEHNSSFTRDMLEGNLTFLLGAGTGTIQYSIEWSALILAKYPEIQTKLQKEIDEVIGKDGVPTFADRSRMPYLQAFIYEIWRFRSVTPINLPRRTTEETLMQGYKIPQNTTILLNFLALDNDPNLWENPTEFNPQRFLNQENQFVKPEYLIPFSNGKRSCPGETLGLMEVFLYLTSFLQRYNIKPSLNTNLDLEYEFQIAILPKCRPTLQFIKRD